jgi:bifunctional NMN adenylyltransferase/nudix hydrolase
MREHKDAVYIGRFQPFHRGHLAVVEKGLELADRVTIVVGSAGAAPNIRNPWTFEERRTMILAALHTKERASEPATLAHRVNIVPLRDYFYNENAWVADVQSKTAQLGIEEGALLLGNYKDGSSYYLKSFPQWEITPVDAPAMDATTIRKTLFDRRDILPNYEGKSTSRPDIAAIASLVPGPVFQFLHNWTGSETYCSLVQEYKFIKGYRESWENAPYPPTFVTVDAIVVCSGHVLVVKRKHHPGKGLYALPGGYIRADEKIRDAMLRELREETKIRVDKLILDSQVVAERVFDHPLRSLRGRTISHGFHIRLRDGVLPEVKGSDDAAKALWMPLMDVARNEASFFEDHAHIIDYFTAPNPRVWGSLSAHDIVGAQGAR